MAQELTDKELAFVEHYLTCWNATEAARRAEYKHPNKLGPRQLVKVGIQAKIQERLAELKMSADEVLTRLTDHARGSLEDFIEVAAPSTKIEGAGSTDEAHAILVGWQINLAKAKHNGKLHLLKKLKSGQWGAEIELHDPQAALALLARHHGLLIERTETTINVIDDAVTTLERKLLPRMADDEAADVSGELNPSGEGGAPL